VVSAVAYFVGKGSQTVSTRVSPLSPAKVSEKSPSLILSE
jgi:hypothetical protein